MHTINDFRDNLRAFLDYATPVEDNVREDNRMAALKQWDKDDEAELANQGRPALVFDNTRAVIDAVAGTEVSNRWEVKFYPRNLPGEDIDAEASDTIQEVHRWIRQQTDVEQQESTAFRDMVISGYGFTHTFMDYSENPDGVITTERVPAHRVGWDANSIMPNFADANHWFRDRWVDEDYFQRKWPGYTSYKTENTQGKSNSLWNRISSFATRGNDRYQTNRKDFYDEKLRKVHVWEYQYRELVPKVRVLVPLLDGSSKELWLKPEGAKGKIRAFIDLNEAISEQLVGMGLPALPPVDWNEQDRYEYRIATIAGNEILEDNYNPLGHFTVQAMTGFEDWSDETRKYYFGLMRTMRDPQKYVNKFFSQAVHIWASSPKGVLMYESDLFEDPSNVMDQWAAADAAIPVRPGSLSLTPRPKFEHVAVNRSFAGAESLFNFAEQAIPKAAGVNVPYAVGLAGDLRRTAASAVQSVQQQNFVALSSLFDALRLYRKRQARLVLAFIREYMPEDQIVRILGPDGPRVVEFTKDDLIAEYDITVDESPVSPNRQQQLFDTMSNNGLLNIMVEQGLTPASLWKYLPFPTDVSNDISEMMAQRQQMQQQMEMMAMMEGSQGQGVPA